RLLLGRRALRGDARVECAGSGHRRARQAEAEDQRCGNTDGKQSLLHVFLLVVFSRRVAGSLCNLSLTSLHLALDLSDRRRVPLTAEVPVAAVLDAGEDIVPVDLGVRVPPLDDLPEDIKHLLSDVISCGDLLHHAPRFWQFWQSSTSSRSE